MKILLLDEMFSGDLGDFAGKLVTNEIQRIIGLANVFFFLSMNLKLVTKCFLSFKSSFDFSNM